MKKRRCKVRDKNKVYEAVYQIACGARGNSVSLGVLAYQLNTEGFRKTNGRIFTGGCIGMPRFVMKAYNYVCLKYGSTEGEKILSVFLNSNEVTEVG